MAVAHDPGEFDEDGLIAADAPREVLGMRFACNPKMLLTEDDGLVLRLWLNFRGGMAGRSHLPSALLRESAWLLDAFAVMDAAWAELDAAKEKRSGR